MSERIVRPLKFPIREIQDPKVQEAFRILEDYLAGQDIVKFGFRRLAMTFSKDVANLKVPHGLNYVPQDIVYTHYRGTGNIIINYDKFDKTNMDFDVTGVDSSNPLIIRMLVGSFPEQG